MGSGPKTHFRFMPQVHCGGIRGTMAPLKVRLLARKFLKNRRLFFPIEIWDDVRYEKAFANMKAQPVDLQAQREAARDCDGPTFSIVVPLYQTTREYLDDMAESVLAQTYPHYELILVNATPESPELQSWIAEYEARDARVKSVQLDCNHGITENTNRGIAVATGDFLCFMDHDDWIEPDTLFEYAAAVRERDDVDLLYCDEDLVEKERGAWRFRNPLFKPDFSPELLLCKNYVVHLLAVRKSIVDGLPTPGSEYDGAQDYNMTFAVSERARRICHVPKILYHWRMSEGSTAANAQAKPYGKRAYRLSIQRHLERTGTQGSLVGTGIANINNIWFRPDCKARVSVVVACRPGSGDASLAMFLEAFTQVNSYENVELVLVGQVLDETSINSCQYDVKIVSAAQDNSLVHLFNVGACEASGDVLVFLDSECAFITPEPIEQLWGMLSREGVGAVAPKVLFRDYTLKSYGVGVSGAGVMPLYRGYPYDYPSYQCNTRAFQNVSAAGLQGLAIRREVFSQAGGFDERFTGNLGAVDLCRRLVVDGRRVVVTCAVELITQETSTVNAFDERAEYPDFPPIEIEMLYDKHPDLRTAIDPFRSPYLDLSTGYPIINPVYLTD